MRIKLFRGITGVDEAKDITQAVFCDDSGKPIAIISSPANGVCMLSTINDEDFYQVLKDNTFGWEKEDLKLEVKSLEGPRR